jgi:hypothetical protein
MTTTSGAELAKLNRRTSAKFFEERLVLMAS